MKSFAKAKNSFLHLKDLLELRTAKSATINSVKEASDSEGWPMLFLSVAGNEAAGQPVIALRMKSIDMVSKDILGNSTNAYTPHDLEIAYELDANSKPTPSALDIAKVHMECMKLGIKVKVKEIANATAVTAASMDAAAVALSLEYDIRWPTKGL